MEPRKTRERRRRRLECQTNTRKLLLHQQNQTDFTGLFRHHEAVGLLRPRGMLAAQAQTSVVPITSAGQPPLVRLVIIALEGATQVTRIIPEADSFLVQASERVLPTLELPAAATSVRQQTSSRRETTSVHATTTSVINES